MSEQIRRLSSADEGSSATLDALLAFEGSTDAAIEDAVANILQAVRRDGDMAKPIAARALWTLSRMGGRGR